MDPFVEIAFDCLPLRSVGRVDAPLDASPVFHNRMLKLKAALRKYGSERTYFLYNAHCLFRLANSEVDGSLRFEFDGVVQTDSGDLKTQAVDLDICLESETCGGVPAEVQAWLEQRVGQAVAIDFDRYIAAGQLSERADSLAGLDSLADLSDFAGMNL